MAARRFVVYPSIDPDGAVRWHPGLRLTSGALVPIWWRPPVWITSEAVSQYIIRFALTPEPEIEVLHYDPYPEPSPLP